ncbi:hypothetical protein LEN26_007776 [Aphanomyces euteiches]|nr:hypothetical protein AeMF1_019627 [Aphanomyces euteiches]KAH9131281.1 hypothetical protein LEN26_007776 [Aphanomyces euteiches]KAH9182089.1 hypothetical protein AeNC1_015934 [Aphanomyces euteiches]
MRVLVPLALAASAVVALNQRGRVAYANHFTMMAHDRLLIDEFQPPLSPKQIIYKKNGRGPEELKYRKKGGKIGAVAGIPLLIAQPMVKRAGKEIEAAYGRSKDKQNAKNAAGGASSSKKK